MRQYCTFHVGELFLGVEVSRVSEVMREQEMTSVPLAPDIIAGLINLRGQIVTAIDLSALLGLGARESAPMNVVLRTDAGPVDLMVDEIGDVIEVDPDEHERVPETTRRETGDMFECVFKLEDRLLLVLDSAKVIERSMINGAPSQA